MDSCNYRDKTINCIKNPQDIEGHECCYEKTQNPNFGHLVKTGTCDYTRGICSSKNINRDKYQVESFTIKSLEGYNFKGDRKIWYFLIALVVLIILITIFLKKI
jgi:hypothetical protein